MPGYKFNEPSEIKLIILYIIKNYNMPLDNGQITDIFMSHSIVDYFTMQDYLDQMIEAELVETFLENEIRQYIITQKGKESLNYFIDRIPLTVRERILLSIKQYQKSLKNQVEINSHYHPINELEYAVDCEICENGSPLLKISISTGSKEMAKEAAKKFKTDHQKVYTELLRILLN